MAANNIEEYSSNTTYTLKRMSETLRRDKNNFEYRQERMTHSRSHDEFDMMGIQAWFGTTAQDTCNPIEKSTHLGV